MAKVTMSKLYNKGRRAWPFDIGSGDKKKTITCTPGRSVEIPTARAEKMVSLYPLDFILGDKMASSTTSKDVKKMAAVNKNLSAENEALKKELDALKAGKTPVDTDTKEDPEK